MKNFLSLFLPHHAAVTFAEKLRSGLAGGVAILWLGLMIEFLPRGHFPLLMLTSIAASTVLLFAAPHSPMAQPWNLVVGHVVSALAGWFTGMLIGDVIVAAAVAVGLAILFMHMTDSLHPPGAATALTMILSSASYHHMGGAWAVAIIAANVGFILILALLINNLLPGRRYPVPHPPQIAPPPLASFIAISGADIQAALGEMGSVIDVSEDDLLEIYRRASHLAQQRDTAS